MYSLFFYVPETHLETVKAAVFAAGAGTIGDYKHCCWQVLGQGQFQPMAGSQPFIGQQNQLEKVAEWRVELVVDAAHIKSTVAALKAAHPYEEPAYAVHSLDCF
ncbi:NGG1p interacting factor NIF3 [Denitrificimonas caeni]|uniref:NGG1p interacting factor NIF3 n=1 Tax=Denitrificimonas caeni TaxID=521720 RepID=UPI001962B66B|nr:NGG1p interacting factor NIF3 [Denitrificimonas caeni]